MKRLKDYANNVFSQNGEDGIIERIFELLPPSNKWCTEFGAWDGVHLSNTANLVKYNEWKGVFIEGDARKFQDLKNNYNNAVLINKYVSCDGLNSLDNILSKTETPRYFDMLSIDIDGMDFYVWQSLLLYRPNIVVIEFNQTIPIDVEFIQEKNAKLNQGNSLLSLVNLGKKKGYELIETIHCNAFFVVKEHYSLFKITDNSIEKIHGIIKACRIFQLYDGSLVLTDEIKMSWNHITINKNELQVLPKRLRYFGFGKPVRDLIKWLYCKFRLVKYYKK